jgi:ankyrin repeat protein/NACHT domain-containing protein/GPI inositol-deacylase-like protein
VDERSACLDCSKALPLPKDHLKLNKYSGRDDSSFQLVCGQIHEMALAPNLSLYPDRQNWLADLQQSNPLDDLSAIKRAKERTPDTCTWLLSQKEYDDWFKCKDSALLRIEGGPGTGKTVLAAFLADQLESATRNTPGMAFAYFFCDNKDENRKSATSILRSLLSQLLRQTRLFQHVEDDFKQKKDFLTNFEALWRILTSILRDSRSGNVFLLIDALDECDEGSRKNLLNAIKSSFKSSDIPMRLKIVITCRREDDIQAKLKQCSTSLAVDRGKTNADLSRFISNKTREISIDNEWPGNLQKHVQDVLVEKAGGTFLWASLVLKELEETPTHLVRKKLIEFPADLTSLYDKLLSQLKNPEDAQVVLRFIISAVRPLTRRELAMAFCLEMQGWKDTLPSDDELDENTQIFTVCEHLVYLDKDNNTVNFIHQSTKEYLLGEYFHLGARKERERNQYFISSDDANRFMFRSCWRYLSAKAEQGHKLIIRGENGILEEDTYSRTWTVFQAHCFFQYASKEWLTHAIAASPILVTGGFEFSEAILEKAPTFRDTWLLRASVEGQVEVVRCLLERGAEANSKNGNQQTSLILSAENGHKEVVMELLTCDGVDINSTDYWGYTALTRALRRGHEAVVEPLLRSKRADINIQDRLGTTALHYAVIGAISGSVITAMLDNGADVNMKDCWAGTPFTWALTDGTASIIKLLVERNAEIEFFYRPLVSRSCLELNTIIERSSSNR